MIVIGHSQGGFDYGIRCNKTSVWLTLVKFGQTYPNVWFTEVHVYDDDEWDLPLPENFKEAVQL
jgi:hypothetical protein